MPAFVGKFTERLAETFNVTPQTIRRDLNQLRALGFAAQGSRRRNSP